mmetsp:Transcript_15752/g.24241  ORF Transcript_15752/g.24241 Transcript_15752/m.24241 type:complete len:281 (+) Transcript_15752:900-1742(+)
MYRYAREFPIKVIPHCTESGDINDIIHNYKRPKANKDASRQSPVRRSMDKGSPNKDSRKPEGDDFNLTAKDAKANLALVAAKPNLNEVDLKNATSEITHENTAKLIGLICHLSYWCVFGHINPLPLDQYHMKQIFISIAQIQQAFESKYVGKRVFVTFIMPMIVLAIRIEVEMIFKNSYKVFFSKEQHEKVAIKQINDVITRLIDPNIYYSRLSFFESGREAINIKYEKSKRAKNSQNKFFTRSALISQLIPNPSEGKVRALFGTGKCTQAPFNSTKAIP